LGHDIDPYRDAELGVDELAWLYADGLVGWRNGVVPLLASLPDLRNSGLVYRYTLRATRWHDGATVRAKDVAIALDQVRASVFGSREPYRFVRDLVVHDDRHFDVVLQTARPGFERAFFGARGVPALPLIRHASDGIPIGTGPFVVRARPELGRWRLERYDGSPRGAARLDGIQLRLLSSEVTANVQLLSGEADIALPLTPAALRSDRYQAVPRFTSVAVLLLNARTVFGDAALRRAFAQAIDVPALQRAYDRRRTKLLASIFLSGGNDLALANALQPASSAVADFQTRIAGKTLTIVYIRGSPAQERTALLLQQSLRPCGVAADLRGFPATVYQTEEGPLRRGTFDVAVYGLVYGDPRELAADWSCSSLPPHGGNFSRWCDERFDDAVARNDVRAMERRIYDSVACIPLTRAYELLGIARTVSGFAAPEPLVPATYGCTEWALMPSSTSARRPSDGFVWISRRNTEA
jgi:ABC-type transport system substrate-binding protein